MLADTTTRALLAVIRQDRPTVRSVAAEIGKSPTATHAQLRKLRDAGLVKWDPEKHATLRAMVTPTAHLFGYDAEAGPSSGKSSSQPPCTNPWSERSAPMLDATPRPRSLRDDR